MKRIIVQIFFFLPVFSALAQYTVTGGKGIPLLAVDDTRNKLEVYLLNGLENAAISCTSAGAEVHQWYRYDVKALDAVAIPSTQNGNTSVITGIADGYGYFVGTPGDVSTHYVWIIDYSQYVPIFYSLKTDDESDDRCSYLKIIANVEAEPLQYAVPTGVKTTLQRNYHLQYTTMQWDEGNRTFTNTPVDMPLKNVLGEMVVEAPLCNTSFTLTGDEFAAHFGLAKTMTTPVYEAIAVEAHGIPEQHKESGENEQKVTGSDLGGSAPVDITFTAYANEPAAAFYIWQITKIDSDTGNPTPLVRYTDKVLSYNFEESGRFIVKLEVIDSKSICSDTTQIFTVTIGETDIKVPNFFSPGSSIGSNDEFRVSYKSLLSFQCSIFNRWGNLLYRWNDPAKGWDGRVAGKFVPTGAYFYVIEYKGTDGKKRTKSGSVNILRSKN